MGAWALVVTGSWGQEAQAPLKTIEEVRAAFIQANGGQENIDSIVSVRAKGTVTPASGDDFKIVIVRKRPQMKRVSMIFDGYAVHRGYNGLESWMMMQRDDGEQRIAALEGDEKEQFEADPYHIDLLFFEPDADLHHQLNGVEYVGRVPCYVVESKATQMHRIAYLDSRSFRVPKIITISEDAEGNEVRTTQSLTNYERVHGIWVAKAVERESASGDLVRVEFSEVEINDGIFNDVFERPLVD